MPRFHLPRPFLFRSRSSNKAESPTPSDGSDSPSAPTTSTTAAALNSSPRLHGHHRTPGKSISLAKRKLHSRDKNLTDKQGAGRNSNDGLGRDFASASVPSLPLPTKNSPSPPRKTGKAETRSAGRDLESAVHDRTTEATKNEANRNIAVRSTPDLSLQVDNLHINPRVILEEPTPEAADAFPGESRQRQSLDSPTRGALLSSIQELEPAATNNRPVHQFPPGHAVVSSTPSVCSLHLSPDDSTRPTSHASSPNAPIIKSVTEAFASPDHPHAGAEDTGNPGHTVIASSASMSPVVHRKIWVKRPGASATLVQIKDDDLVDDVRDMILRKYANSLGRTFDAPDMTLRVVGRADHTGHRSERVLGPEEEMYNTIVAHYPSGQTVDDALIIDVPVKRTPRPSPRHYTSYHAIEDLRPQENGTDYFPPMPAIIQPTLPHSATQPAARDHHIISTDHPRSISVLNTGQVPPLPSPGGRRHRAEREHRPKYGRQHTSSPTIISHPSAPGPTSVPATNPPMAHHRASNRPRLDSSASEKHHTNGVPAAPPLPTPPAPEAPPTGRSGSTPPTPSGGVQQSHRLSRPRKTRKPTPEKPTSKSRGAGADGHANGILNVSSMLDGSVPPINVLIVEDNIINLRILEGLMKRLKVRWQTAMNGQIAVDKWKGGGYHLVLMDIQMPVMNGLQATKEIRRLERVNGIGVFSSSTPGSPSEGNGGVENGPNGTKSTDNDQLPQADGLFKSPVIIVALTASSLQSDRHEALAAGCNDFLTKPVNFVWLERKVKEWGCMQALIDFDGWRKWKDYAAKEEEGKSEEQKQKEREQEEKQKIRAEKMAKLQEKQRLRKEEEDRKKRESIENGSKTATVPEEPQKEAAATENS